MKPTLALRSYRWLLLATLAGCASTTPHGMSGGASDAGPGSLLGGRGGPGSGGAGYCSTLENANGDASAIHALLGDAAASCTIRAADYDRDCKVDSDCVEVGDGDECTWPCIVACPSAAINVRAHAQYQADYAQTPLASCAGSFCHCPCRGLPRCRGGMCEMSRCGADLDSGTPAP
jgi:hypothetical protein